MKTYRPGRVPDNPSELSAFLRRELESIRKAANSNEPCFFMQTLHASPERTVAGMVVCADGTDWDPGSGAGVYRRDEANANWVFLG